MFTYFVIQTQLVGQLTICNDYDNNHVAFVLFIYLFFFAKYQIGVQMGPRKS